MNLPRYIGDDFGGFVWAVSIGYGDWLNVGKPQMSPFRISMTTLPYTYEVPSGLRIMV